MWNNMAACFKSFHEMKCCYTMVAILFTCPMVDVLSNPVDIPVCVHLIIIGYLNVMQVLARFEGTFQEVSKLAKKQKVVEL